MYQIFLKITTYEKKNNIDYFKKYTINKSYYVTYLINFVLFLVIFIQEKCEHYFFNNFKNLNK